MNVPDRTLREIPDGETKRETEELVPKRLNKDAESVMAGRVPSPAVSKWADAKVRNHAKRRRKIAEASRRKNRRG